MVKLAFCIYIKTCLYFLYRKYHLFKTLMVFRVRTTRFHTLFRVDPPSALLVGTVQFVNRQSSLTFSVSSVSIPVRAGEISLSAPRADAGACYRVRNCRGSSTTTWILTLNKWLPVTGVGESYFGYCHRRLKSLDGWREKRNWEF